MQKSAKFCILFSLAFISGSPTLWGKLLFDDGEAILSNRGVVQPSTVHWTSLFWQDFWGVNISHPNSHKSYRPFTTLTYRLTYGIWGPNPFPYHLENLLIHGLNCGLCYFFLLKCLRSFGRKDGGVNKKERSSSAMFEEKVAFWASILFSVHPIHVEVLGAVVGRADLLSSLVFILGFLSTSNEAGWKTCFSLILFSIIGSLFKETAITLTILHVCLQFSTSGSLQDMWSRKKWLPNAVAIFGTGAFVMWRLWFQGGPPVFQVFDNPPAFAKTYFTKVSSIIYVWSINAFILLNPVWLCYDWSGDCIRLLDSLSDLRFALIVVFGCICVGLLIKAWTNRLILVSCIIFGTTFLPSSNLIFTVGFVLAERNLYLPSIGFVLLIAYVIIDQTGVKVLLYIITILMAKSIHRSYQWQDQSILFISGAAVCPNNAKIHYNLGTMYADNGNVHNAEKAYKYAITLRYDYYQAMNNLGNLLRGKDINEAEYWLKNALQLKPDFAAAWMNLGIVLSKRNQSAALTCYQNALKFRKIYPDCQYNLGNLYLDMGNNSAALECWTTATLMKSGHVQSWINRVILLEQEEKLHNSKMTALAGLEAVPNSHTLHFLLGNILGKLADFEAAKFHFIKAIDISTHLGQKVPTKYFSNLGVLYHRWGRRELAIEAYSNALKIDPGSESVTNNLRLLKTLIRLRMGLTF